MSHVDGRAKESPAKSNAAFTCQVCHKSYERQDHLNRHLDSRKSDHMHGEPTSTLTMARSE